ncbi:hypothetical protein ACU4GD_23205 [Cupriavidus basilensis]
MPLLYALAGIQEIYARLSGKPVLLSLATVRLMVSEVDSTCFSHAKSERELGLRFQARSRKPCAMLHRLVSGAAAGCPPDVAR